MKHILSVLALCVILVGCVHAQPLTREQASYMAPYQLCSYEGYESEIAARISREKINCPAIIRTQAKKVMPTFNTEALCGLWYTRPHPQIADIIEKEVSRRKLDCVSVVQGQQQIQVMQQQVEQQRAALQQTEQQQSYQHPWLKGPVQRQQDMSIQQAQPQPIKSIDYACVRQCRAKGMSLAYCNSACSY